MNLRESFRYPHGDPSVSLFNQAVQRWDMPLPQGAKVLELGCCETDFSKWLQSARPDVKQFGVDVNLPSEYWGEVIHQSAESCAFDRETFDAVIALGSIEHFGLGFYGDPVNETADLETVALVESWLTPGGWLYYDVPWTPLTHYVTENRHFRVYDDATLQTRLHGGLRPVARGYASGDRDVWQDERPSAPMVPFWYAIEFLEKAA